LGKSWLAFIFTASSKIVLFSVSASCISRAGFTSLGWENFIVIGITDFFVSFILFISCSLIM